MADLPRLMLVTDRTRTRGRDLVDLVAAAARGGVRLVQVREKDLTDDGLRELVLRIRSVVPADTQLIVNGHVRVARTMGTGLHLPAAAPFPSGIDLAGQPLGRSVHDEREMQAAVAEGSHYLVVGTVFRTESKPGRAASGLSLVERIARQVHPRPIFAIGGISVTRIPAVIHSGAHGVAVSGAILGDNDPERIAQAMTLALDVARRA